MKKHDEGYVLAYVTVVLLIFCLVATAILTGALRNLQTQQSINEQMKDQYVAEGMIEKVVSQWEKCHFATGEAVTIDGTDTGVDCLDKGSNTVTLSVTYGSATITCMVDKNGNYSFYDVAATELPPSENGGEIG